MDAQRWAEIEPLYHAALSKDPAERSRYLEAACAEDPTLRKEVESLLAYANAPLASPASHSQLATLWGQNVGSHARTGESGQPGYSAPAAIGRYRIIRLIGEGGMGVVYEAEQEQPRRIVALKVVKPGLAAPALLRRFEQESQALARLQHPGIAQIYEAGTADSGFGSQPYFAMELIRGQSLREYAQALQLNVRQRLDLMIKICDAVHHAHQRGVIHRDLKPGNILVDAAGQPKILDFGVARSTDSEAHATRQTDLGQVIGTLAYMSPEQVLGDPLELDTRTDVYSLGVILYELLAGHPPYQISQKLHEAVQTIREEDPARLSSISRVYRGDVETIVAKALEKDKARRYASAADLAADIRHYLQDEPIVARPASTAYQLSKFVRRHKALGAGVAAVFVVLVGGVVASAWQAARATEAQHGALLERDRAATAEHRATNERDRALNAERTATAAEAQALQGRNRALAERQRADTEAATAKAVNDFLQNDLLAQASPASQGHPEKPPDPELKVRTALDRAAARLKDKFTTQPLVEASIRLTIGQAYMDLGLWEEAQPQIERAVALRRRELGERNRQTLESMYWLAGLYRDHGKYVQAEALGAKVLEAQRHLLGESDPETLFSMNGVARAYVGQGKYEEARLLLERTVAGQRRVLGEEFTDTLNTMNELAVVLRLQGKYTEAEPLFGQVLKVKRRVLGTEHPFTLTTMNDLAVMYGLQGKYPEAEALLAQVVEVRIRILGETHPDTLTNMGNLGEIYRIEGKYAQAEPLLVKSLDGRSRILGEEHSQTLTTMKRLADLYAGEGKYQQAEALYNTALQRRLKVSGPHHPDTLAAMHNLAELLREEARYAEAEVLFNKALEGQHRVLGPDNPATTNTVASVGELRLQQQQYSEAEALLRSALSSQEKKDRENWKRYNYQILLGASLAGQGRYDEAEPLLLSGYQGLVEREATIPWESRSLIGQAAARIVQLYLEWGRPEQTVEWRNKFLKP